MINSVNQEISNTNSGVNNAYNIGMGLQNDSKIGMGDLNND